MPNLETFNLADMSAVGAALRRIGSAAESMEDTAMRASRYLFASLLNRSGGPACALVRLFKTHSYNKLPPDLQASTREAMGSVEPWPELRCLTLLGTAGIKPEFDARSRSIGHKAIPLVSENFVKSVPMVTSLITQFGLEAKDLVKPHPGLFLETRSRSFNVFHVADAVTSPMVPAKDGFVVPLGVRSVVGFGGPLPSGDIFAMILFAMVPLDTNAAQLFKTLSLSLKIALISHDHRVFT